MSGMVINTAALEPLFGREKRERRVREEGRILIINYLFLVLEMNRSLRNPKDD